MSRHLTTKLNKYTLRSSSLLSLIDPSPWVECSTTHLDEIVGKWYWGSIKVDETTYTPLSVPAQNLIHNINYCQDCPRKNRRDPQSSTPWFPLFEVWKDDSWWTTSLEICQEVRKNDKCRGRLNTLTGSRSLVAVSQSHNHEADMADCDCEIQEVLLQVHDFSRRSQDMSLKRRKPTTTRTE